MRGDIRYGNAGEFRPLGSSEENLRIIRGTVSETGTVLEGTGFTATRLDIGRYQITFTTPFPGNPTFTGNAQNSGTPSTSLVMVSFRSPTQVGVVVGTGGGGWEDCIFKFTVVGPR